MTFSAAMSKYKPIVWPGHNNITREWVIDMARSFEASTYEPELIMSQLMPASVLDEILNAAIKMLSAEPIVVDMPLSGTETVTLVGDLHGQYHDLLRLFTMAGIPSETNLYVFNGDYVDRGAWGLEVYVLLLAWKLWLPDQVMMLRGNHETQFCTSAYGFQAEVDAKYGPKHGPALYKKLLKCFTTHPLAAVVGVSVFVSHGGLFRKPAYGRKPGTQPEQKMGGLSAAFSSLSSTYELGNLADLRRAARGGTDPDGQGASAVASDVLWSDPSQQPGLRSNSLRGVGLFYGPDCTQQFLTENGLRLVVRSHEGPDARERRPEMQSMEGGFAIDHSVAAGALVTLFSAPDYPQFQAGERGNNRAAFLVLRAPDYCTPHFTQFEAVKPRPNVRPYYDFAHSVDSDDELDISAAKAAHMHGGSNGTMGKGDDDMDMDAEPPAFAPSSYSAYSSMGGSMAMAVPCARGSSHMHRHANTRPHPFSAVDDLRQAFVGPRTF
eukprot:jgi/Mesvir1/3431/Mv11929-RA.1